jgi:hypothetical protein
MDIRESKLEMIREEKRQEEERKDLNNMRRSATPSKNGNGERTEDRLLNYKKNLDKKMEEKRLLESQQQSQDQTGKFRTRHKSSGNLKNELL